MCTRGTYCSPRTVDGVLADNRMSDDGKADESSEGESPRESPIKEEEGPPQVDVPDRPQTAPAEFPPGKPDELRKLSLKNEEVEKALTASIARKSVSGGGAGGTIKEEGVSPVTPLSSFLSETTIGSSTITSSTSGMSAIREPSGSTSSARTTRGGSDAPPPPPPPPPPVFDDDPLLIPELSSGVLSAARTQSVGVRTPLHISRPSDHYSSRQRQSTLQKEMRALSTTSRGSRLADLSEDTAPIEKEGWLLKEGRVRKSWKKRWFVLKGSSLAYFAGVGDAKPKGVLSLDTAKLNPADPQKVRSPNGKPCLELLVEGRKLIFATVGTGDFQDWLIAINNKISCLDYVKKKKNLNQKTDPRVMLFFASPHNEVFCCDNDPVPLEAIVALKSPIKYHLSLQILSLENASIGDLEVQVLSEPLAENTTIQTLNLARNSIGPEGAVHFAVALKYNKSITSLYMHDNKLGPQGVKSLAECLPSHRNLSTFTLGGNGIGDEGMKVLVTSMLMHNHVLPVLSVPNNKITSAGAQDIAELCKKSNSLVSLQLENNEISNSGVSTICSALTNNETVTDLELASNNIDSLGVLYLAQLLQMNPHIKTASLQGNSIGEDSLVALVASDESFEFAELEFTRDRGDVSCD